MAEEIILDLKVETGDSNIRIGEVTQGVKDLKQNIEDIDFTMVTESFTTFTTTIEEGLKSSVATAQLFADKNLEIQKITAAESLKIAEQNAQDRLTIATSIVSSLASLGNILIKNEEKAAKFQRALAVAQLAIDTALAISSAIRAAAATSLTPVDLAIKIASSIAIVLANIAQAKKLLSVAKVPASPGLTVAKGGGGGIPPHEHPTEGPRLGPLNKTRLNPDGTIIEEQKILFVKAFVVETEMTESQKKIKRLRDNVTFE